MERACELVELLGAGEVVEGVMDVIAKDSNPVTVKLEPEKVNGLLGTDVSREEMARILESAGLQGGGRHHPCSLLAGRCGALLRHRRGGSPVLRLQQHPRPPSAAVSPPAVALTPIQQTENRLGSVCRAAGYDEIITYSFISPTYYDKIDLPEGLPPAGYL